MAARTFSDEQLVNAWTKTKATGGTRRDVVTILLNELQLCDNCRPRVYNNVTQRIKSLSSNNGVKFPSLARGQKGTHKDPSKIAHLQAILDGTTET